MKRFLPWIILTVAAACIAANWLPPKTAENDFDFSNFGKIQRLLQQDLHIPMCQLILLIARRGFRST